MAVFRIEKNKDYTTMSNYHLRDNALSLKAKGLLSQMLSLPEDWDYTLSGLAAINQEGKDAIRSAVQELETAGYIRRQQTRGENGIFSCNEYVIYERPVTQDLGYDKPYVCDNGQIAEPNAPRECGHPVTGAPATDEPPTETTSAASTSPGNSTEINIDIQNTDLIEKKKKKKEKRGPKSAPDWKPERFAKFWEWYRTHCRGENKQAAIRAWDKLKPDDALIDRMGKALQKQIQSPDWQNGFGIPYASTWLNNARWDDEPKVAGMDQRSEPSPDDYF